MAMLVSLRHLQEIIGSYSTESSVIYPIPLYYLALPSFSVNVHFFQPAFFCPPIHFLILHVFTTYQ